MPFSVLQAFNITYDKKKKKDWRQISQHKKEEREGRLPAKWRIEADDIPSDEVLDVTQLCVEKKWLDEEELAITGLSAVDLAAAIRERKYTALTVTEAFGHRATIAQQLVNALTEINFDQAIEEAKRLDKHLEDTGEVVGPMHGVPISVKDQFHVKGLDTTMGYCAWAGNIAEKDSVVVTCLKQAGAIVLAKTNVAQALMMYESINPVFGRTLNPYNRSLIPGGSSGGEAALIALRGSAIGLASDYGGSIREPSTECGLYGLRPSWGRISFKDSSESFAGLEARHAVPGPIAHSPEDLDLYMSSYMAQKPWTMDHNVLNMPWSPSKMPVGPICFAIAYGDENNTPHPPVMRGLRLVASRLREAGHMVVEWQGPLLTREVKEVGDEITQSGMMDDVRHHVESTNEPIYAAITGDTEVRRSKPSTPYHIWQLHRRKQQVVDRFHALWQSTVSYSGTGRPIDGLITPVNVCVATPHAVDVGPKYQSPPYYEYPDSAAILDATSAAFPTGLRQDPAIDLPYKDFKPKGDEDKELQKGYGEPEKWAGAPIGLQIVAQRLEEEKVVGMLCKIRDALEGRL